MPTLWNTLQAINNQLDLLNFLRTNTTSSRITIRLIPNSSFCLTRTIHLAWSATLIMARPASLSYLKRRKAVALRKTSKIPYRYRLRWPLLRHQISSVQSQLYFIPSKIDSPVLIHYWFFIHNDDSSSAKLKLTAFIAKTRQYQETRFTEGQVAARHCRKRSKFCV